MADTTTTATTGQGTAAADAPPQGNAAPTGEGQPSGRKFTDDETAALLKENMDYKKRLKALEKQRTEDDENKLKEQGKYKELAETAQTKAQRAERIAITAKLESLAAREGLSDPDLLALVDTSGVTLDDDGKVQGAAEAIAAFKAAKPHFFGSPATVPGTAKPGSPVSGGYKTYEDWKAAPAADRIAWAQKHPQAFKDLANRAVATKR